MPKRSTSKTQTTRRVAAGGEVEPPPKKSQITEKQDALRKEVLANPLLALRPKHLPAWKKSIEAKIRQAGGIKHADLETIKDAEACAELGVFFSRRAIEKEWQTMKRLNDNPLLARRILAVRDELHVLLNAESKQEVRACELLSALHYVSKHPNWQDETTTSMAADCKARYEANGSRLSDAEIEELKWMVGAVKSAALSFDLDSLGIELGRLICEAVTKNPSGASSFFERLSKMYAGLGEGTFDYEALAGAGRDRHLRLFYLVRHAKLPQGENADDPNAKLWLSRKVFAEWLTERGLAVAESWVSGLFKYGPKAWAGRDELKRWLSDKLGITNPPEPVLSEYWDKHNNAMPALSSLIENAQGKGKRAGGKRTSGKRTKQ